MSEEHLVTRIAKDERIAWMRLNRPQKKNALTNQMMDKMIADIKTITEDKDIKRPGAVGGRRLILLGSRSH